MGVKDFSGKKAWGSFSGSNKENWLKFHFVHKRLIANLCVDLQDRGFTLSDIDEVDSIFVDEPGMIAMDRPLETLKMDSLKITVPSEDISSIYERVSELESRYFKDGTRYFKLKTYNVCLIMDESQKTYLERTLESMIEKAEKKASAFYDKFVKSMGPHDGEIN